MSVRNWLDKIDGRMARGMTLDDARNTVAALADEVRRRGQLLARQERQLMSKTDTWKAFRMGIVASCPRIPTGDTIEAQRFWHTMRERFLQWFKDYQSQGGRCKQADQPTTPGD